MTTKKDGGPAFPRLTKPVTDWSLEDVTSGMSLRDWFAGQCMRDTFAALAASGEHNLNEYQLQRCARASYLAADAMIAERSK